MDHDSQSGTEMYYSDSSVRMSSKHSSENEQFVMEVDTMRRQSTPPPYQDQSLPSNSHPQNPIYGNAPQLPTVVTREEPLPSSSSTTQVRPRSHTSAVPKPGLSPHHLRTLSVSSNPSSPNAQMNLSMPDLRNGFTPQSPRQEPNIVFPFIPVSQLPLPSGWELGYTKKGRPYFIDHVNQRTTFEDPRFPPGYVPTVVLQPNAPINANTTSTHNTNSGNNNNTPSTNSIYGNAEAVTNNPPELSKSPSPVYANVHSTGSLRPHSGSVEKQPMVRVSSKDKESGNSSPRLSLSQDVLMTSTGSLSTFSSASPVGLARSGSLENSQDSNESFPIPSSGIPLATASGVPASTKIALDPKFNSRKKYKDVILSQIQTTKEDLDRAHKQNLAQSSKFKEGKEKAAILKHQTDLQHIEKQNAQQMKQKIKEIELTQTSEKKKCKARWKEEQKQDEDKASSLPWQNKEVVQKQLTNQLKEKQQQLDHFHLLQHLELTQQLMRQQQKQLFEEKIKQAIEDSDFMIDFSINSLKEEREHHRKVNEISLKILQRIHALNRTEMMEEHRKQQEQLAAQIKEEHKSKTKEFKSQEKERKKEQEKNLKKELASNKSASKKEIQATYDAENEKLYHKHLQTLEKKKEEEEVQLHQKQMKLQEELRQSQYALEQQQARELFEKDQKLLSEHAEKVQRDIQSVFKNCKKYFQEKDNLIPVLQQHITMLFSKLDEQLLQHQNLIKEQYDKLVALYDKESEKERQASIKLERKSMRDKRSTVRSGVTEASGIEDKMSFLQQVHVKNQKIVRQKAWYQRQEMYLLCGRNHAEKGVLVNKRNLLASKHKEEMDLVEFVGIQLKEMTNHFFHISYNSWKSFLEERAGLVEGYQPYIDSPISMPADTNLALLETQHEERSKKFDVKLEQTRASVRKQLQEEMQDFEIKYDRTMQTHALQEDKLKAEHENDLRQLEIKFEKQIEEIQQEYGIYPQPRGMGERSASSNRMTNRAEMAASMNVRQVVSSPETGAEPSNDLKKVVSEKDEEIIQLRKQLTELQKKYTMKEMAAFSSVRHEVFDIREDLAKHRDDMSVPIEEGSQESRSRSATTDSESSTGLGGSPTPVRVVALFAFTQRKDDQLSFAKGDIITVLKQRKSGWWKGELNGRVGKFPSNYCKVLEDRSRSASVASAETKYSAEPTVPPSLPHHRRGSEPGQPKFVRALYTYTKKKPNQISFAKGDIIKVVEEKKSGWWVGELNGLTGKFPSNFCEVITDTSEIKNMPSPTDKPQDPEDHDVEGTETKPQDENDTGKMRRALEVLQSLEVYDSNDNSGLSSLKHEFDVGNLSLTARNHDLHSETDTDGEQLSLKLNIATANQKLPALTETDKANALLELERLVVDSDDDGPKVVAPAVVAPSQPVMKTATRALVEDSDDDQTSEVFFKKQLGLQAQSPAKVNPGSMRESDYLNKIKMLLEQGESSEEE